VAAIIHYIPEETIEMALVHPLVMAASDGVIANGRGHPRGSGTFARVLGRYVRERRVLSLPEAIRKVTLMPAHRLERSVPAMSQKGRLAPGADADIVVFDPTTVIDRATFADPAQRSAGMRYVMVAGQLVIDDGRLMEGVRPGRAVRREGR
jgi:N-acyl-D-aspartate/D-glutamate deacylase